MKLNSIVILVGLILMQVALFVFGMNYISQYAEQVKVVHNELTAWKQKGDDLRRLQSSYLQNEDSIMIINQALPSNAEAISFFERLEQLAEQNGLDLTLQMGSMPAQDVPQKLEIFLLSLSVKGSYSEINNFVKTIENIDQLVVVRHVSINSPQDLSGEIIAKILVKTYFALPG